MKELHIIFTKFTNSLVAPKINLYSTQHLTPKAVLKVI